jgi:ABC-type transport system involved in multi-copper enzyme maturation permease subunit
MFALLKKDFNLNRIPIFGGGLLIAVPYLIMAPTLLFSEKSARYLIYQDGLVVLAMALMLTVAVAAIFGGAAFALERRERSAEFLAMLPVRRSKIVVSKLLIGAGFPALFWGANLLVFRLIKDYAGSMGPGNDRILVEIGMAGFAMLMAFGVAWLGSSILSSPAIAACISIGITLVWLICVAAIFMEASVPGGFGYGVQVSVILAPIFVGGLGILAGGILFVNKGEP